MIRIYPSLMAADPLCLKNEIQLLAPYCAGFHLDVMDNHFVPNITWGADTVNAIAQLAGPVWVHLMVEKPDLFYDTLKLSSGSIVSFHIESNIDVFGFIKRIKEKKYEASIAISPKTPFSHIMSFLNNIDQVLVMSVEPGFSGQHFLKSSLDRISELVAYRQKAGLAFRIGIDGGINAGNIMSVVEKDVDDCAIGSGIFQNKNSVMALQAIEDKIDKKK